MYIIVALLVFGFIVTIHEFGHFYFAKRAGVTIYEFSIGMGPSVYTKEKDGIKYSVRIFPIGGYVAMAGEDEESDDPNSFEKKPLKDRLLSILAGPLANIILCVVLLIPVYFIVGVSSTTFEKVLPDSAAQQAGLKANDRILAIDNTEIKSFNQLTNVVAANGSKEMTVKFERDNKVSTVRLKPKMTDGRYLVGIVPKAEKSPLKVIPQAFATTYRISKEMLSFLFKLVTGQLSGNIANSLAGPVGVIQLVSNAAQTGFVNVLQFTAIISLNIGIINLLPIPALDGWRILMLLVEFVRRGKKLPAKTEDMINGVGLVALLSLMVFLTYKDILRIIH